MSKVVIAALDRLAEIHNELDPLLDEKRQLEGVVKGAAERYQKEYQSTVTVKGGTRVLKVSYSARTSWSSTSLVKLAKKLKASPQMLNACKSVGGGWTIKQVIE